MPVDMSAAVKAPPRRTRNASVAKATTPTVPIQEQREYGLNGFFQSVQSACILAGPRHYAQASTIGTHMPGINHEVSKLADSYGWLATGCDFLIKAGPLTLLAQLAIPFVAQTLANYGVINADKIPPGSGIVSPKILEAQVQADLAKMQAEALRQQQQAMEDAERARADYNALIERANANEPVMAG